MLFQRRRRAPVVVVAASEAESHISPIDTSFLQSRSCRPYASYPGSSPHDLYDGEMIYTRKVPVSCRTSYATIYTTASDQWDAFESDAFAMLMPETRIPITTQAQHPTTQINKKARAGAFQPSSEKSRQGQEHGYSNDMQVSSQVRFYGSLEEGIALGSVPLMEDMESFHVPRILAGSFPVDIQMLKYNWTPSLKTSQTSMQISAPVDAPVKLAVSMTSDASPDNEQQQQQQQQQPCIGSNPPIPQLQSQSRSSFKRETLQLEGLVTSFFKIVILIYAMAATYHILNAVRDTLQTMSAAFRLIKSLGRFL